MRIDIFHTLWTHASRQILSSPYLADRPFRHGFASGVAFGLVSIATVSSVALFFEFLALIFNGSSNTLWQIIGVIFSLPWPGLFATPDHALPWILGGIIINLFMFGLIWGMFRIIQAHHNA